MDTGGLPSGYANADLEHADVVALAKAMSPAYMRLSGGTADSLGYRPTSDIQNISHNVPHEAAAAPHHCTGGDCGNCDVANGPGGPPVAVPPTAATWFNRSAWQRINTFAGAAGFDIIFGLNSMARATTASPWDGRFGMAKLINWTASQALSKYPVVGYELGYDPSLQLLQAHPDSAILLLGGNDLATITANIVTPK